MLCCQEFGVRMAQRDLGSIVNALSVYSILAPDQCIYKELSYEGQAINMSAVYNEIN